MSPTVVFKIPLLRATNHQNKHRKTRLNNMKVINEPFLILSFLRVVNFAFGEAHHTNRNKQRMVNLCCNINNMCSILARDMCKREGHIYVNKTSEYTYILMRHQYFFCLSVYISPKSGSIIRGGGGGGRVNKG